MRVGSVGDPSAEMKLTCWSRPSGRLSTARVAGSRQPMSTIRAASASPVGEDLRPSGARDDAFVGAQDVDDAQARGRGCRRTPRRGGLPSRATENAATSAPVTPGIRSVRVPSASTTSTRAPVRRTVHQPQVAEHVVPRAQHVGAGHDRTRHPCRLRRPRRRRTRSCRCRRPQRSGAATRSRRGCAWSSRACRVGLSTGSGSADDTSTTRPPRRPQSCAVSRAGGVELLARGHRGVDAAAAQRHGRTGDRDPHPGRCPGPGAASTRAGRLRDRAR